MLADRYPEEGERTNAISFALSGMAVGVLCKFYDVLTSFNSQLTFSGPTVWWILILFWRPISSILGSIRHRSS